MSTFSEWVSSTLVKWDAANQAGHTYFFYKSGYSNAVGSLLRGAGFPIDQLIAFDSHNWVKVPLRTAAEYLNRKYSDASVEYIYNILSYVYYAEVRDAMTWQQIASEVLKR